MSIPAVCVCARCVCVCVSVCAVRCVYVCVCCVLGAVCCVLCFVCCVRERACVCVCEDDEKHCGAQRICHHCATGKAEVHCLLHCEKYEHIVNVHFDRFAGLLPAFPKQVHTHTC